MAYYPFQTPHYTPQTNNPIWVQGIEAAKSYIVAPNTTVLLMDSETNRFFLKSSDASGMPLPLRVFEYTEKTGQIQPQESKTVDLSSYATKAEFDAFREEINGILKHIAKDGDE